MRLDHLEGKTPVKVGVMEGYSRWAKSYDTTWNTLIATEELYSWDLLDGLAGDAALDVGAGTGRFALKLARRGWTVTAVDPNPEMLAIARRAASSEALPIECKLAALEEGLPVEASAFDLAVCALTLCHVPGLREAALEFRRVLAPGGHLLVTDIHPDFVSAGMPTQFRENDVTYVLPNEPHTRQDYVRAIEDAGLTVSTALDVPGKEVPGGFVSEFLLENFADVNFALIVLAQKPSPTPPGDRPPR